MKDRLFIRIDEETKEKIQKILADEGMTLSQFIRLQINDKIFKYEYLKERGLKK